MCILRGTDRNAAVSKLRVLHPAFPREFRDINFSLIVALHGTKTNARESIIDRNPVPVEMFGKFRKISLTIALPPKDSLLQFFLSFFPSRCKYSVSMKFNHISRVVEKKKRPKYT